MYTFRELPDWTSQEELRDALREVLLELAESVAVSEWQDFTLSGGWSGGVSGRAEPGFCSTGTGFVYLRGSMSGGTTTDGTTIATLPEELGPRFELSLPMHYRDTSAEHGGLRISTSGEIKIYGVSGTSPVISLDGATFRIGQ